MPTTYLAVVLESLKDGETHVTMKANIPAVGVDVGDNRWYVAR